MVAGEKSARPCLSFKCTLIPQANILAALNLWYYAKFELLSAHCTEAALGVNLIKNRLSVWLLRERRVIIIICYLLEPPAKWSEYAGTHNMCILAAPATLEWCGGNATIAIRTEPLTKLLNYKSSASPNTRSSHSSEAWPGLEGAPWVVIGHMLIIRQISHSHGSQLIPEKPTYTVHTSRNGNYNEYLVSV